MSDDVRPGTNGSTPRQGSGPARPPRPAEESRFAAPTVLPPGRPGAVVAAPTVDLRRRVRSAAPSAPPGPAPERPATSIPPALPAQVAAAPTAVARTIDPAGADEATAVPVVAPAVIPSAPPVVAAPAGHGEPPVERAEPPVARTIPAAAQGEAAPETVDESMLSADPVAPVGDDDHLDGYSAAEGDGDDGYVDDDDDDDDYYEYEDDYVELPPHGRVPRWAGAAIVFALLITLVVGGGAWWYHRQIDPPGSPGEVVSVTIPRGASLSGIGSILSSRGVVRNGIVFNFYASRKSAGPFEAGVYQLKKNSDIDLVLDTLAAGPTGELPSAAVIKVSLPEGLTAEAMVTRISNQVPRFDIAKLEKALADGKVATSLRPDGQPSYEGLLFPATYDLGGSESEIEFLDKLAGEMETRVAGKDVEAARARIKAQFGVDVSAYDLLIVASLVQSEAGGAEEAAKIATVIYNRLAADSTALTLGIDAVDDYGAELAGVDVATFRETAQPYNTRKVKGLPPTPISAPGDYALNAAFRPAEGPWIYYVLTDPGIHTFVVTDGEFQQAKAECQAKGLCG